MKTLYDASDTRPLQYALTASITSLKESMILDTPHFLLKIAPFQQGAKIPHTVYHKTAPKTTVPLYKGRNFLKSPSSEPSFQQIVEKPWWKTARPPLK